MTNICFVENGTMQRNLGAFNLTDWQDGILKNIYIEVTG